MAADLVVVRVLVALLPCIPCVPSDQLREVVRLTPPNKLIEVYVGDSPLQWRTWSRQPGVSLIGDAAHAMLPTFGKPVAVIFRISSIVTEKIPRDLERTKYALHLRLARTASTVVPGII